MRPAWRQLLKAASAAVAVAVAVSLLVAAVASSPATAAAGVDGKIAYADDRGIWLMNPDGSFRTLIVEGIDAHDPTWSPDGTKILFLQGQNSAGASDIWIMNADGTGQRELLSVNSYEPVWSPDSSKFVYRDYEDENPEELWVMNADGSGRRQITQGGGADPSWSPDGARIVYSGRGDIRVMNPDGSGQNQLTFTPSDVGGYDPSWSPDGSRIAYTLWANSTDNISVMNADGSGQTQLTHVSSEQDAWGPEWSPDGARIAFHVRDYVAEDQNPWVMNANGSSQSQLFDVSGNEYGWFGGWSPDGTKVLLTIWNEAAGRTDLWTARADGSDRRILVEGADAASWGTHPVEPPLAAGAYRAVPPSRLLDTRFGVGASKAQIGAGKSVTFQVAGRRGVPSSGAGAAVLNVTVTRPGRSGYVTAFPAGASRPAASNLNFVAGQTIANHVTVKLGSGGKATLFNGSTGPVDMIVDVAGWYAAGAATEAGTLTPMSPVRLANKVTVGPKGTLPVAVAGQAGIPSSGVSAGVLNVTVTAPTKPGYITAFPNGTARPNASNLNFVAGQTIPNAATVRLGGGAISLFNGSVGNSRLIADVAGWFKAGTATVPGAFTPVDPTRLLDTRNGIGAARAQVGSKKTVTLTVAGKGGVPGSGPGAAVLNVTVTRPGAAGYVTAFPTGTAKPNASNINFVAGQTIPNLVTVKLGGGKVTFFNGSTKPVDVVADVAGWYRG